MMELMTRMSSNKPEEESSTYECDVCKDRLYIFDKDENGLMVARQCECYPRQMAKRLLKNSGLESAVQRYRFDNFECETPTQRKMKDTAEKYLHDLLSQKGNRDVRHPWLYMGGNPGSGKTHLCTAVCGELLKANVRVRYMQWTVESRRLKFSDNEDFEDQLSEYINADM